MREFKDSITGKDKDDDDDDDAERSDDRPGVEAASAAPRASRRRSTARSSASARRASVAGPSSDRWPPRCDPSRTRTVSASSSTSTSCASGSSSAWSAFAVAFAICFWQNNRILDIINRPLDLDGPARTARIRSSRPHAGTSRRWRWSAARSRQPRSQWPRRTTPQPARWPSALQAGALIAAAAPRPRAPAGDPGRRRAVHGTLHGRRPTRRCSSRCRSCSTRRTRSSYRPSRHGARSRSRDDHGAVPVHRGRRVRLLHGLAARDQLPAELQRRQLRHPHPGADYYKFC